MNRKCAEFIYYTAQCVTVVKNDYRFPTTCNLREKSIVAESSRRLFPSKCHQMSDIRCGVHS